MHVENTHNLFWNNMRAQCNASLFTAHSLSLSLSLTNALVNAVICMQGSRVTQYGNMVLSCVCIFNQITA